jgi:hypothetical protein
MKRTMIAILLATCACSDDGVKHLPDAPVTPDAPASGRTCTMTAPTGIGADGECAWAFSCTGGDVPMNSYGLDCMQISATETRCTCTLDGDTANTITVTDGCLPATDMCALANAGCGWLVPVDCP